jgi:predicted MFS family arabinose efflux permease
MTKHGFSFWYAAAFIFGAIQLVALPILIPTYIYEMTGSMFHSGAALSSIGLCGFVAPIIGGVIDKYRLHAAAQKLAVLCYVTSMAIFVYVPLLWAVYLATFLIGLGSITLLTVNPTFIVAAGFSESEQSLRLTRMNQSIFVGAIVMGLVLWATEQFSVQVSFFSVAILALVSFILINIDSSLAAEKMTLSDEQEKESGADNRRNITFITFLLAVFIAMFSSSNQVAQGPNLFSELFSIERAQTSLLLTVSSVISLLTLDIAGRFMNRVGPGAVWIAGLVGYAIVGLSLHVLVGIEGSYLYLPLILHLVFMQCLSLVDMVKPAIVAKATTMPPATTQGYLLFAIAGGYALGTSTGGVVASCFGVESLFVMITACALLALGFAAVTLKRLK